MDATNMAQDQELFPCLHLMYHFLAEAVITFWYDDHGVIQHWHTTDWDKAGWSVVKEVAASNDLRWHGDCKTCPHGDGASACAICTGTAQYKD